MKVDKEKLIRAMKLEAETGRPWLCEAVKPFREKGKEVEKDG